LSYLQDVAQEWFEPGISGLTDEPPEWFDNWEAFLDELCTNFGSYNEIADAKHELTNLCMRDNLLQLFALPYFYFYFSTFTYVIPLIPGHESSYL
jgi:hypothetical protein